MSRPHPKNTSSLSFVLGRGGAARYGSTTELQILTRDREILTRDETKIAW